MITCYDHMTRCVRRYFLRDMWREGLTICVQATSEGRRGKLVAEMSGAVAAAPRKRLTQGDLFAILDIYQSTQYDDYLTLARVIGNNIVAQRFVEGYFAPEPDRLYARHDAVEPLALLALQAAIEGKSDLMPIFLNGSGGIHGSYVLPDGEIIDSMHDEALYRLTRAENEKWSANSSVR